MKRFKKVICLTLILSISVLFGGCNLLDIVKPSKVEVVTEYLNNKYPDDNFYFSDQLGGTFDNDKMEYYFTSDKFPDTGIWAAYCDNGEIIDNYVNIKYEQQVQKLLNDIIEEAFPEMDYYVSEGLNTPKTCVKGSSNSITFDEFITQPSAVLKMEAFVDISNCKINKEIIEEKLGNIISSKGILLTRYKIYFVDGFPANFKNSSEIRDDLVISETFDCMYKATINTENMDINGEWNK